ncbi:hypothetical protein F442_02714 [Phytophthora nicotianae P10297]|uniref:Uncharacterized protein n=4 Tax=Phytophthora nicotianae TaxID=4792 RepID=W2PD85_PHYN3|nr:hypothetical protein PPTG_24581 [Phytophthora nicotianae INRA-310]ETK94265.1 hypothetical protein L915_02636 [Phytophthora nicotianae]ETO72631.1 hypothetical protein F444_11328 [Phytophthora nicotianae P1976]ETP52231.1 hypothetical protein F442_02714 [Phytophthora nicotianae P10297]ETL47661.1 hypothetical protein L916_02607 [Phytophthora nicotianae]ETM53932.1 hypothetical protein L914_02629 [Phytophthora nicotianae]
MKRTLPKSYMTEVKTGRRTDLLYTLENNRFLSCMKYKPQCATK